MSALILGAGLGILSVATCYVIAFGIGRIISRADKREDNRLEYLSDNPRLASFFRPPHDLGG